MTQTSTETDPVVIVQTFVERINRHDLDGLAELMTKDHVFVDSLGQRFIGRDKMRSGWRSYFNAFPDYEIRVDTVLRDGDRVALFGAARGTYAGVGTAQEKHWQTPAAWHAVIRNGRVREWRIYCDTEMIRRTMTGPAIVFDDEDE